MTASTTTFAALGLAEPIQRALDSENYATPTPIQTQAIPVLMQGRDLLGIAQTGTGKTAAFALPILHQLTVNRVGAGPRGVRALVLAPTRELAIQIAESMRRYGRNLALRQAVIFGGVGHRPQMDALSRGVDVLVATPGRLLDLMSTGHAKLDRLTHLVLDEADRMLDMGFIRDVRKIVAALPAKRQSMLFSATMPGDVAKLAADLLTDPARVEVAPVATPAERIDQRVYFIDAARKRSLLTGLLADAAMARVIVFTRTKHGADRVAYHLERAGIEAQAIHGNKSQNQRQRALAGFHAGDVRVLVATDIASRGIDVDDVTHVVNYELPNEPDSYVHRIGRTARAGATGVAISLCDRSELQHLRAIEKLTRIKLTVIGELPAMEPANDRGPAERRHEGRDASRDERPRRSGDGRGPKRAHHEPAGPRRFRDRDFREDETATRRDEHSRRNPRGNPRFDRQENPRFDRQGNPGGNPRFDRQHDPRLDRQGNPGNDQRDDRRDHRDHRRGGEHGNDEGNEHGGNRPPRRRRFRHNRDRRAA